MANNNQIYKMSNAGGFKSLTRYYDMLAGNTTWNPWSPAGAYDALATVTVDSGGAASITFAGIPTGYKHLQIRGISKNSNTSGIGTNLNLNFNGDTAANYSWHSLYGDGGGTASAAAGASTSLDWIGHSTNSTTSAPNLANIYAATVLDILDYSNTSKNKTLRVLNGHDTNGAGYIFFNSGGWYSTNAITSITLSVSSGNFVQYSSFALYGVK